MASADGADEPLRIATFQADVSPPLGSPLLHGWGKPAAKVLDPLTARGIVLVAGDAPIVLCAIDWAATANAAHDAFRDALAKAVGTSRQRVSVHTVHQHNAPGIDFSTEDLLAAHGLGGRMFDRAFATDAIARTARAAAEAAKHPRRVTHLGYGKGKVEKVASSRRPLTPEGKLMFWRAAACRSKAMRAAPEGTIDPFVRLLSFWDGNQPLAALTYYACHPCAFYGDGNVSAELVGMARALREAALPGVPHVHFNGAGGDIAVSKYNDGSRKNRPILARRLAAGMKTAWDTQTRAPIRAADVVWSVRSVRLPIRKSYNEARALARLKNTKLGVRRRIFAARELAWTRRLAAGCKIDIGCLRLGPARVLHMPGELFVEYQLAAQRMRPDAFVCMAAYGDHAPAYICTRAAYPRGGYEPGASRVAPEVEDVLMAAMRDLLEASG